MLVLPIIGYSSFLLGHNSYEDKTKIHNNTIRCFMYASTAALVGNMGWLLIAEITISCALDFD